MYDIFYNKYAKPLVYSTALESAMVLASCNVFPLATFSTRTTATMHSTLVRAQNVFGFFTTVAFCTALLTALSVLLSPQNPSASIELRNIQMQATPSQKQGTSTMLIAALV